MKNHKNIGIFSNSGPDLVKYHKLSQANIQCWAINGPPDNDDTLIMVFGSSLPSLINQKRYQSVITSYKTF